MLKGKDGKVLSRSEGEAVMKSRGAVTISIYALLLAVCSLFSNSNSGKILTNTLAITDTWAFYQAKSIKQNIYELRVIKDPAEIARYDSEKKELFDKATKMEEERELLKQKSPYFSMSSALFQIAIVLSSTAILAVSMEMLWASVIVGMIASALFGNAMFLIW